MITVAVLARESGTSVHTVRHYTNIGLLKPKRNNANGYKVYQSSDIVLLRFINNAKELGFTLKEISEILDEANNGKSPCPIVREIIEKRINETRQQIKNLKVLQKKMEAAKQSWETLKDGLPDGHSVCHLIESFAD